MSMSRTNSELAFVVVEFLLILVIEQYLCSKYGRKPIKGSKDSDDSLDFKKTSAINGPFGWRPGPGKLGQKKHKTLYL